LPVTTLEEMAVEETIEMCAKLRAEFGIRPRQVLMNLVSPLLGVEAAEIETLRHAADPAMRFASERGMIERERAAYLAEKIPAGQTPVERVRGWKNDLDLLRQTGEALEKIEAGLS
jgi:hypothetical protein